MEVTSSASYLGTQFEKEDAGPKVYEKTIRDVANDSLENARDVGQVRLSHSRLNIFTSLVAGDTEDNFKFSIASPGPLRLGGWQTDEVHVQLLNAKGEVIADSEESNTRAGRAAYEKYELLTSDNGLEDMQAGDYYIRVTRLDGDDASDEQAYSLQLQMGETIEVDYDTTEVAAKPVTGMTLDESMASPATLAAQQISSMLDSAQSNMLSLLTDEDDSLALFPPVG